MTTPATPTTRPVLVYDGDCGICTKCVQFVYKHLSSDLDVVAWQHADLSSLRLTQAECENAVQWVEPDGSISAGHLAVSKLLKDSGALWWPLGAIMAIPPFSLVAKLIYRWVANNRDKLPGGTPACAMPAHLRPGAAGQGAAA